MADPLRELARRAVTASRYAGWRAASRLLTGGTPQEVWSAGGPAQRVLILAPHPDDEVFACGGSLALRAGRGDRLTVLYFTDGARGTRSGRPNPELPALREQEAAAGLAALGAADAKRLFARLPDGSVTESQASEAVARLVGERTFDAVFSPWFGDEHPDHLAVSAAAARAFAAADTELWLYEMWSPLPASTYVPILPVLERKRAAVLAHASQVGSRGYLDAVLGLNAYRGFQKGLDGPAEAFLRTTGKKLAALLLSQRY